MSAREAKLEAALVALLRELHATNGAPSHDAAMRAEFVLLDVCQVRREEIRCALFQTNLFDS